MLAYCMGTGLITGREQSARPAAMFQETRASLGLDLDGSIVIIDEAHNLSRSLRRGRGVMWWHVFGRVLLPFGSCIDAAIPWSRAPFPGDAIAASHSAMLARVQADTAHRQLASYLQRYRSRLAPGAFLGVVSGFRHLPPAGDAGAGVLEGNVWCTFRDGVQPGPIPRVQSPGPLVWHHITSI